MSGINGDDDSVSNFIHWKRTGMLSVGWLGYA